MALKPLSEQEREDARSRALQARTARASVKQEFAEGKITIEDLFRRADEDEAIGRMRTLDLLKTIKNIGQVRAETLMEQNNIALNRRLRGLGPRQRERLENALSGLKSS